MLLVVVVHTNGFLGQICGVNTAPIIKATATLCDPVFFALSGFFAMGASKKSLRDFYLNKVVTVIVPLVLYAVIIYCFEVYLVGSIAGIAFPEYFCERLFVEWWFIPTLVPCLVAAPFLARMFDGLSRSMIAILFIVYIGGSLVLFAQWAFGSVGNEELASLALMLKRLVPPSFLSTSPAYFVFFLLGCAFKKTAGDMEQKNVRFALVVAIVCWAVQNVFAYCGIPQGDPCYLWLPITFGIFVLFGKVSIRSKVVGGVLAWTAQRSYSIYLVQYSTIAVCAQVFYYRSWFGVVAEMNAPARVAMWLAMVACSYLLALLVASLVDSFVLKPLQGLMKKILFCNRERRF